MASTNRVTVNVHVNLDRIQGHLGELFNDEKTRIEIHNKLATMCDPYVPMLNGPLHESAFAQVSSDCVRYGGTADVPYAHYQYYGVNFNHTIEKHPLATAKWDEAMLRDHGDEFNKAVENILVRRYKELYG